MLQSRNISTFDAYMIPGRKKDRGCNSSSLENYIRQEFGYTLVGAKSLIFQSELFTVEQREICQ